jgi:HAMP domain-containing protein
MNAMTVPALVRRTLLSVFLLALLGGVGGFYLLLRHEAMDDAEKEARNLMAYALAVRDYTATHITDKLGGTHTANTFFEEAVPSYSSRTVFAHVGGKATQYTFRQPTLNPTSSADLPTPFETEVIEHFRSNPKLTETTGVRDTAEGQIFYLAQPVRITDPACLDCHSTPERAPPAMIAKYGPYRGFNWSLNETVGALVLSVPLTEQLKGVLGLVGILTAGLLIVFATAWFAVSSVLDRLLIRPLKQLAEAAESASLSAAPVADIQDGGVHEVGRIANAISRLRISLGKAMDQLETRPGDTAP